MSEYLLISDAAKEVKVESHVLRYWEEELHLPIKRNELGHRYYTEEDVERFKQIKSMKERGLQLKAIKMILKDGRLDVLPESTPQEERKQKSAPQEPEDQMAIHIIDSREIKEETMPETIHTGSITYQSKEEKSKRLQWLLQQLIRETLVENNQELCREIKESVVKELDYQFRAQEEREEERDRRQEERSEEYYKKMDELLRSKSASYGKFKWEKKKKAASNAPVEDSAKVTSIRNKKKRHFLF